MSDFEKRIGYEFKDKKLLKLALTHSSYANEHQLESNERLEFLGDSILGFITSVRLYKSMPNEREGVLSKTRSSLVCETELAKFAEKIGIGDELLLGHGERTSGGGKRPSVTSDAFEALIAAIYLDSNIATVQKWVLNVMNSEIKNCVKNGVPISDYKSALQERVQHGRTATLTYELVKQEGEDHNKRFTVCACIDGKRMEQGTGTSKKEAEQDAAKNTMNKLFSKKI